VTYLSPQPFSLNNDRKDQTSYNNRISAFYSFILLIESGKFVAEAIEFRYCNVYPVTFQTNQ
jgi:hypothetical protein